MPNFHNSPGSRYERHQERDSRIFETDGPTEAVDVNDPEGVLAKMMATPGMEMGFEITRPPDSDRRLTFSVDALETLENHIKMWVGSRILRKFKSTGMGARKLQVHVIVSQDGELPPPVDSVPFFAWPDDQHRTGRKR